MPERAPNGILRTQPVETSHGHVPLPIEDGDEQQVASAPTGDGQTDWTGWETWMAGHKNLLMDEVCDLVGDALGELRVDLRKKLAELENKLAEVRGALDVLRGRGVPGLPNVRGTYRAGETYGALDVVALDGSSFIARRDAPGPCPGSGWQLLCSRGRRGEHGERGPMGFTGAAAPRWVSTTFDTKEMAWTPRFEDGTRGPPIPAKMLFHSIEVDGFALVVRAGGDGADVRIDLKPMFQRFLDEVVSLRGSR